MKKLLLFFLIFSSSMLSRAQDQNGNFICAPVIGLNYAGLTGSNYGTTYQYIFGGQVGLIVNVVDLNRFFSLRAEVNGSMQGAKFPVSFSGMGNDDTYILHLTYLNLPIVSRYHSKCGFFGEAGLQPSFLLGARAKVESVNSNVKGEFRSFDLGIPFGLGYEFKNHFGAGIRCVPGLMNVYGSGTIIHRHNLVTSLRLSYAL
jgi:hypothetical protein